VRAPRYNPPASSALLSTSAAPIKPEDVKEAEALVRCVIQFQQSDGCFDFRTHENVKKTLGQEVFNIVTELLVEVSFKMAVTITLVALLEERFEQCKDLWLLVVQKAKDYVAAHGRWGGIGGNFSRIERAGRRVQKIKKLPLGEGDEIAKEDLRVEVEVAPY
jgi:hypothetical protein